MKNFIIYSFILLLTITIKAQDQKTILLKNWIGNKVTPYEVGGTIQNPEIYTKEENRRYTVVELNSDSKYKWGAGIKSEVTEMFGLSTYSKGTYTYTFYIMPDQQAHPTYLTYGADNFDKSFTQYIHFSKGEKHKLIAAGDYLYKLDEFKGQWQLKFIYVKGGTNPIKRIKNYNKLKKIDHYKIINDYLAKEEKILAQKASTFKKENAEYYNTFLKEATKADADIADGYRQLWEQQVGNAARVLNNTGRTIWVGTKTGGGAQKLEPGDTGTFKCDVADIHLLGHNGDQSNTTYLFTPKSMCGKKYVVK